MFPYSCCCGGHFIFINRNSNKTNHGKASLLPLSPPETDLAPFLPLPPTSSGPAPISAPTPTPAQGTEVTQLVQTLLELQPQRGQSQGKTGMLRIIL